MTYGPKNKYRKCLHVAPIFVLFARMNNTSLRQLILDTKGRFFSLTFTKKDGSKRVVNGKNFYREMVRGTGSPATDALKELGYVSLIDRNKQSWVSAHETAISHFKCGEIEKTF